MPYKTIHWVKLEKRLLNDHRFYTMNEESQLIYVKFLMLAAETNNKIPKNNGIVKIALRSCLSSEKIKKCIEEIKTNFPKFKEHKDFYYFKEWGNRCNWIVKKELPGNSQGTPREALDKNRIEKIRIEYIKAQKWDEKDYMNYGRDNKAIKTLLLKANDEKVIEGIQWIANQGYSWTLETLIGKWPNFMAQYKRSKDPLAKYEIKEGKRYGNRY